MTTTATYAVTGMTCDHCVRSVTTGVKEIPGVSAVDVVLESGSLTVSSEGELDEGLVRAAVEEAGYGLRS
jgi:copper chaperone